jgi:hypothetical protein
MTPCVGVFNIAPPNLKWDVRAFIVLCCMDTHLRPVSHIAQGLEVVAD